MQDGSADGEDPIALHGQQWADCRSSQFCSLRADKTRVLVTKGHRKNILGTSTRGRALGDLQHGLIEGV